MWILRILILILASRAGRCGEFSFAKNANNYGFYTLSLKKYEACQGPKAMNMTIMIAEEYSNETSTFVTYNITFINTVRLNEIKIHVSNINGKQKTTLWNYRVDKPCQHFMIGSVMAKYLPMQQNCIVKKAELHFVVDFTAIARQFFGDMFFYGDFMFKIVILSQQGNVLCNFINMAFVKK